MRAAGYSVGAFSAFILLYKHIWFYNTCMALPFIAPPRHLRFAQVVPGGLFHVGSVTTEAGGRGILVGPHTHDFYEIMLVVAGRVRHTVHGKNDAQTVQIQSGDVVFIRPTDCHEIQIERGRAGAYLNVAFAQAAWQEFTAFAGSGVGDGLNGFLNPPAQRLEWDSAELGEQIFRTALIDFQRAGGDNGGTALERLALARFLSAVLPLCFPTLLVRHESGTATRATADAAWENAPLWLLRACRQLRENDDFLREGLPCLVRLSGVSASHLARVFQSAAGQTPTEYVNGLRLSRAAMLLTTTTQPIVHIAWDCGFVQLSYFYRLFHARFGTSPQKYRTQRTTTPVGGSGF